MAVSGLRSDEAQRCGVRHCAFDLHSQPLSLCPKAPGLRESCRDSSRRGITRWPHRHDVTLEALQNRVLPSVPPGHRPCFSRRLAAISLSNSSATAILGFFASPAQVGYYSAAEKFIKAAIAVLNPMNQALYPHVTAKKSESPHLALALIRRSLLATTAMAALVSIAIFFFAHGLCRFVLGPHFFASALALRYMAPLPLLSGLMSVLGTQTMVVFGMDKLLSTIMLSAAAFSIPVTALLSRLFGVVGAALSSLLVALFIVAFMMVALRARGFTVWQSQCCEIAPST